MDRFTDRFIDRLDGIGSAKISVDPIVFTNTAIFQSLQNESYQVYGGSGTNILLAYNDDYAYFYCDYVDSSFNQHRTLRKVARKLPFNLVATINVTPSHVATSWLGSAVYGNNIFTPKHYSNQIVQKLNLTTGVSTDISFVPVDSACSYSMGGFYDGTKYLYIVRLNQSLNPMNAARLIKFDCSTETVVSDIAFSFGMTISAQEVIANFIVIGNYLYGFANIACPNNTFKINITDGTLTELKNPSTARLASRTSKVWYSQGNILVSTQGGIDVYNENLDLQATLSGLNDSATNICVGQVDGLEHIFRCKIQNYSTFDYWINRVQKKTAKYIVGDVVNLINPVFVKDLAILLSASISNTQYPYPGVAKGIVSDYLYL